MSVRCKEMTERLKIIEDEAIEAIDAIDGGPAVELAACVSSRAALGGSVGSSTIALGRVCV
jgi:hypothetical protein